VARVAAAFANNGQGVRGDMKAVIKAVLLDAEAITPPTSASNREAARACPPPGQLDARISCKFKLGNFHADQPSTIQVNSLGQTTELRSPSVFNFYRPEYQTAETPASLLPI